MPVRKDIVLVDDDGVLQVLGEDAARALRSTPGRFRLLTATGGLLILQRATSDDTVEDEDFDFDAAFEALEESFDLGGTRSSSQGGRVVMAGEILDRTTLFNIVGIIAERHWQGDLTVFTSHGEVFGFSFDRGALKRAHSDRPEDRLGELLIRQDVLARPWLEQLLEQVTPQVRLGQLMVERGILTQAQLFECLTRQTEEIFRVALVTTEGAYAFTTPDRTSIGGDLTVHLPLQHLLMRTAQRLDEWALFQQLIPNANVQPRARPHAMTETMEPTARALLARCDGATPLHAIARDMGLREFEAIKVLYYLLEDEKAELASTSPPLDVSAVREATAAFSELLRDILAAVDATGSGAQARVTLRSWIESTGYATYFGDRVSDDGSIDVDTVVAVLSNLQDTDRLATLHQISHEVVSFTLFCAGQVLSRDEELALSGDVNRRLLAIGS